MQVLVFICVHLERILEMQQHMESFGRSRQCIHESFEKTVEILRSCGDNQLLSNETRDAVNEINKIVNTVGNLIQQLKGRDIEQKDVLIIDSLKAKATSHLDTIIRGVGEHLYR